VQILDTVIIEANVTSSRTRRTELVLGLARFYVVLLISRRLPARRRREARADRHLVQRWAARPASGVGEQNGAGERTVVMNVVSLSWWCQSAVEIRGREIAERSAFVIGRLSAAIVFRTSRRKRSPNSALES